MENKEKIIYYIESALNIIVAITIVIMSIINLLSSQDEKVLSVVFICVASLLLLCNIFILIKIIKNNCISYKPSDYVIIATSVISLVCSIIMLINFNILFPIILFVISILSCIFKLIALNKNKNTIKYNHVRRSQKQATSHTIQISTEYLVKDSYTPEEAENTLKQLYSIRDQQGFSMEDYERIKEKILKNVKK